MAQLKTAFVHEGRRFEPNTRVGFVNNQPAQLFDVYNDETGEQLAGNLVVNGAKTTRQAVIDRFEDFDYRRRFESKDCS